MKDQLVHLGEVAEFINGRAFKPCDWCDSGLPIIRIQNLTGTNEAFNHFNGVIDERVRVRRGDILISWSASLGVYRWQGNDAVLNQHIFKAHLNKGVEPDYFFYAATNAVQEMVSRVHGSTMQHITKDRFDSIQIRLPDLSEQRQIAARLEQAERLVCTRRYALGLSNTLLPAAFLERFGDPKQNPKQWGQEYLANVCVRFSDGPFGSNLKSEHYKRSGVRVVRLQNIGVGEFIDDDKAFVSKEHFAALRKHECLPGDLLIGTLGDPNLRACVLPTDIPIAINKADCVQARPNPQKTHAQYLSALLNMPSTLHLVPGMVHGQTRARVSMGELAQLPIPLPPLSHQLKFAALVERVESLRAVQREALRQAEHLFQALLREAFRTETEMAHVQSKAHQA